MRYFGKLVRQELTLHSRLERLLMRDLTKGEGLNSHGGGPFNFANVK